jgi:arginine decarboxylase
LANLLEVARSLRAKNLQEYFHDAVFYRDEIHSAFQHGDISLRTRALADQIFWHILTRIAAEVRKMKSVPQELRGLEAALADVYYCNFSVFQSVPDAWAVDQLFPIMPIHRLREKPTRLGFISDITCDCDGKIDAFIDPHDVKSALPLHAVSRGEEYLLGIFLVGAYQETLGDLHNLFGDTNVVSIRVDEDGEIEYTQELRGDSVGDVLSYVEYNPGTLMEQFRALAEDAVKQKKISPADRRTILTAYENSIRGYTYFES